MVHIDPLINIIRLFKGEQFIKLEHHSLLGILHLDFYQQLILMEEK